MRLREPRLPTPSLLGPDLFATSPGRRWVTLLRPMAIVALYAAVHSVGFWWLTPLVVFFLFVAIVTSAHDVVHGAIGLGRRATHFWLYVLGAIILASGHSYRLSHLQHHRVFPGSDDPEGEPARMSFWQAVKHGPTFLPRLWLWGFRRASPSERSWLIVEACTALGVVAAAIALWPVSKAPILFAGQVYVGAWVFPLLTVHLPHHGYGDSPFTQTRTLRGRVIPAIFLELTYHLEHHLYPQVPSHHLAELSQRLEPVLQQAGVVPVRVP